MTREELKGYPYLIKLIDRYERELAELYDNSAWGSSPDMTGIHTGGAGSKVESGYLRNEDKIQELTEKLKACRKRLQRMDQFFNSIEDPQILQIFELRFKKQMSWMQISTKTGCNKSPEAIKQICYRYFKKNRKN